MKVISKQTLKLHGAAICINTTYLSGTTPAILMQATLGAAKHRTKCFGFAVVHRCTLLEAIVFFSCFFFSFSHSCYTLTWCKSKINLKKKSSELWFVSRKMWTVVVLGSFIDIYKSLHNLSIMYKWLLRQKKKWHVFPVQGATENTSCDFIPNECIGWVTV